MNSVHAHLIFIHFPIAGVFFALMAAGLAWKFENAFFRRVALAFIVIVGLFSIPAYISGDGAKEMTEQLSGIDARVVEQHDEAAEVGFFALMFSGGIALLLFVADRFFVFSRRWTFGVLFFSLIIASALIARAANLGGLIRHPEIEMSGRDVE